MVAIRRTNFLKTFIKLISFITVLIGLPLLVFFIYLANVPDDPLIDDSILIPEKRALNPDDNGYEAFLFAMDTGDEAPREFFRGLEKLNDDEGQAEKKGKKFRNYSQEEIEKLKAKYESVYENLMKVTDYSYIKINPEDTSIYDDYMIVHAMEIMEYGLMLAWESARAGDSESCIFHIEHLLKLGRLFVSSTGSTSVVVIGFQFYKRTSEELNEIINSGLIPDDSLGYLYGMLEGKFPASITRDTLFQNIYDNHMYNILKYCSLDKSDIIESIETNILEKFIYEKTCRQNQFYNGFAEVFLEGYETARKPIYEIKTDNYAWSEICSDAENKARTIYFRWHIRSSEYAGKIVACIALPNELRFYTYFEDSRLFVEMIKTNIAVKRYQYDHGAFPVSLEMLIPEYMDSIVTDPFDGKPLKYDKDKKIIYSSGYNYKDDGGEYERDFGDAVSNHKIEEQTDIVVEILK